MNKIGRKVNQFGYWLNLKSADEKSRNNNFRTMGHFQQLHTLIAAAAAAAAIFDSQFYMFFIRKYEMIVVVVVAAVGAANNTHP